MAIKGYYTISTESQFAIHHREALDKLTISQKEAYRKELSSRRNKVFEERKAAGIKSDYATQAEAEAAAKKLKVIAAKYNLKVTVSRAFDPGIGF
jgi:activator of HSP90 ATPase